MKKKLFVFLLLLVSCCLLPVPVFAHVLKTSGNIGAVLHIDPADEPVAGKQSTFFLELKDKKNQFNSSNCECKAIIKQKGKEIFATSLFTSSLDNPSFSYTFPQKGEYELSITGKSIRELSFAAFSLSYAIDVDSEVKKTLLEVNPFLYHTIHYGLFILVFAIFFGLAFYNKIKGNKVSNEA